MIKLRSGQIVLGEDGNRYKIENGDCLKEEYSDKEIKINLMEYDQKIRSEYPPYISDLVHYFVKDLIYTIESLKEFGKRDFLKDFKREIKKLELRKDDESLWKLLLDRKYKSYSGLDFLRDKFSYVEDPDKIIDIEDYDLRKSALRIADDFEKLITDLSLQGFEYATGEKIYNY